MTKLLKILSAFAAFAFVGAILLRFALPSFIPDTSLVYIGAVSVGALAGFSLMLYERGIRAARQFLRGWCVLAPIAALLALVIFSVYLSRKDVSALEPLSSPGVLFVFVMAVVTLFGFLITVSKLDEMHARIYDYSHLIERCEELVHQELNRVEKKGRGKVVIFANAPAFGIMSVPDQYARFENHLLQLLLDKRVEVHLACLSWKADNGTSPHDSFYRKHWPFAANLEAGIQTSNSLIARVIAVGKVDGDARKTAYRLLRDYAEVPFHLFMTSDAAILFVSLGYPIPELEPNGPPRPRETRVQIIGFETSEKVVIGELEGGFLARVGDPKYSVAESDGPSNGGADHA